MCFIGRGYIINPVKVIMWDQTKEGDSAEGMDLVIISPLKIRYK